MHQSRCSQTVAWMSLPTCKSLQIYLCCTETRAMAVPKSACTQCTLNGLSHYPNLSSHLLLLAVIACPNPHQDALMAEREAEETDLMFRQGYRVAILNCRSRHIQMVRTGKSCNGDFILRDTVIYNRKILKKWVENHSVETEEVNPSKLHFNLS